MINQATWYVYQQAEELIAKASKKEPFKSELKIFATFTKMIFSRIL